MVEVNTQLSAYTGIGLGKQTGEPSADFTQCFFAIVADRPCRENRRRNDRTIVTGAGVSLGVVQFDVHSLRRWLERREHASQTKAL